MVHSLFVRHCPAAPDVPNWPDRRDSLVHREIAAQLADFLVWISFCSRQCRHGYHLAGATSALIKRCKTERCNDKYDRAFLRMREICDHDMEQENLDGVVVDGDWEYSWSDKLADSFTSEQNGPRR